MSTPSDLPFDVFNSIFGHQPPSSDPFAPSNHNPFDPDLFNSDPPAPIYETNAELNPQGEARHLCWIVSLNLSPSVTSPDMMDRTKSAVTMSIENARKFTAGVAGYAAGKGGWTQKVIQTHGEEHLWIKLVDEDEDGVETVRAMVHTWRVEVKW
jgi:hypothetical protein